MTRISHQDYDTLQRGLRDLYAHHSLDTLPKAALQLVNRLVPNNLAGYNEVDPSRRRLLVLFEPASDIEEKMRIIPNWERYMHQHPVLAHFQKNPLAGPHKISDFLSDEKFRKLELYTEFYRKINAQYQMALNMPSPAPLVVALAINRDTCDFDERDREILSLFRPHLRQAYENATVISELAGHLDRAYDVLDRIDRGIVVVNDQCRVQTASPAAVRFSSEHFGSESDAALTYYLPETLLCWAKVQISALRQDSDEALRPTPLIVDGPHGRLVVRATCDREPGMFLLVMHLARPLDSAEPLRELGLTKREAEVLYWMINGKPNIQIGSQLTISERTVDKHAQNLFGKLDVANRAEAVAKALEWLRL